MVLLVKLDMPLKATYACLLHANVSSGCRIKLLKSVLSVVSVCKAGVS